MTRTFCLGGELRFGLGGWRVAGYERREARGKDEGGRMKDEDGRTRNRGRMKLGAGRGQKLEARCRKLEVGTGKGGRMKTEERGTGEG
jgi:hypothetical protein